MANFNELSGIKQWAAALGVAALITGALYFTIFKSQREANATAQAALDTKLRENAELESYKPKLVDIERQLASLKQQLEIERKIVPDEKEVPGFMKMMNAEAAKVEAETLRAAGSGQQDAGGNCCFVPVRGIGAPLEVVVGIVTVADEGPVQGGAVWRDVSSRIGSERNHRVGKKGLVYYFPGAVGCGDDEPVVVGRLRGQAGYIGMNVGRCRDRVAARPDRGIATIQALSA
jgi:hypothetical protein